MPRKITSADFVISAVLPRDFPTDGRPEVALVGRSNVGKSSLINALVRRAIARTSASPGKTRQVNVYGITPAAGSLFHLMDLPGYGHAGGGEKAQRSCAALTALYFGTRTTPGQITPGVISDAGRAGNHSRSDFVSPLRGVVLTVDARHPGLASDIEGIPVAPRARRPAPARGDEGGQAVAVGEGEAETRMPAGVRRGTAARLRDHRAHGLDEFWQWLRELIRMAPVPLPADSAFRVTPRRSSSIFYLLSSGLNPGF